MDNKQLSKNFSFFELTQTTHRKYLELNRQEGWNLIETGIRLCDELLQPIRNGINKYSMPKELFFIVHSGFRCVKLNKAIGGSPKSQHCKFEACDFHITGLSLQEVFDWIGNSNLKWGQLILEGWASNCPSWIHISLPTLTVNQQVLTFDGKNYIRLT